MVNQAIIVTCEHGGNIIPAKYKRYFQSAENVLNSHLGFDAGALHLARSISKKLNTELFFSKVSRLLVDLNRSATHKKLLSQFTSSLSEESKQDLLKKHYLPYRQKVEKKISSLLSKKNSVLHFSIHSFTPVLNEKKRKADIGILFDPARKNETILAKELKKYIKGLSPDLNVRFNYPYLGISDGFVPYLRKRFGKSYVGLEIEFNQSLNGRNGKPLSDFNDILVQAIYLIQQSR